VSEVDAIRNWASLQGEMAELKARGLWRELRRIEGRQSGKLRVAGQERDLEGFASNDYLGLAEAPEVVSAVREGLEKWGAGSGASRLVCGTFASHLDLERTLAAAKGAEAALTFSSGFAVPHGVIPALLGPGDTVILDKLSHACLVDAAKLSGATIRVFPHNHLEKLERLLATAKGRVLVVTESVFSMDGDRAALREIVALKQRFGAWLLLDEAHAFGVIGPQGRGLAAELGLESQIDLQMGTLSKAAGLSGGYVAGRQKLMDWLINRARSFIYSTAPPPFMAHASRVAVELLLSQEGEKRREHLRENVARFRQGIGLEEAAFSSAIVPVWVGDERAAVALSERLRQQGFWIPAIRYPTVARGAARLRVTLSALHEAGEIEKMAGLLVTEV
jgi:8-amino-7-oxononanoate synthase